MTGKNKAEAPTLSPVVFQFIPALPLQQTAVPRAKATGRVSMSPRPDPEISGAVEIPLVRTSF